MIPTLLSYGKRHKVVCNVVALFVLIVIIIPITWLVTDRDPPFILTSGEAIPDPVATSGTYKLKWKIGSSLRECPGIVRWVVKDSEGTLWTTKPEQSQLSFRVFEAPDGSVVGRDHIIPSGASTTKGGVATLSTSADFVCNFTQYLWPIHVVYPDVHFRIITIASPLTGPRGIQGVPSPPGPQGDRGQQGKPGE